MGQPTEEQAKYISYLEDSAALLQKTQVNYKKSPKGRLTKGYIRARLQCVEEYWQRFVTTNDKLLQCTPREQRGVLPYFLNEEFYKYEELYLCLKADMLDLLSKFEEQRQPNETTMDTSGSSGGLSGIVLPRIQVPRFSGKYDEFPAYQDLFLSLIHGNTSLADVQKLHYLKTSLTGEAESLLRHIQVTDKNYLQAWELLKNRYGNKKLIANSIFKRLFHQKKINTQSANSIKALFDTTTECLNSLKNLQIDTDSWDPVIVFLIIQKLDDQTHKEWEEHSYNDKFDELSKWSDLQVFLQGKFRTLELITPTTSKDKTTSSKTLHVSKDEPKHNKSSESQVCTYCKGSHYIYSCKDFIKLSVQDRHSYALKNKLCFNCLAPNHSVYQCRNQTVCRICHKGKHHSLLHLDKKQSEEEHTPSSGTSDNCQTEQTTVTSHHSSTYKSGQQVLLATALVDIISSSGESHVFRCLIDQGSEASFVTARVVDLLKIKKSNTRVSVSGIGEEKHQIKHLVNLSIKTKLQVNIPVKAYVTKSISSVIPAKEVKIDWEEIRSLNLADPNCYKPGRIDILLGVDVFATIIEDGLIRLQNGLVAQNTGLGWILSGSATGDIVPTSTITTLHITEEKDMLRKFWEIENEPYSRKKLLSKEEEACEEIYRNTTTRDTKGRYIVELPLKQSLGETIQLIGDTKEIARKRFHQLERKFERDSNFKLQYKGIIDEYLDMGHMIKLDTTKETALSYLPHHAVIRNDKDTSKVRIEFFDASVRGTNGHSLNNTMMVGPVLQLQPDLRSLLIGWRTHKICIVSDIIKMFRMVKVADNHANLQCILWRNNKDEDIEEFKNVRVSFGTAAAPYLTVRTLKQLADDEGKDYPEAADAIKHCFYMDDLMTGHHEVEAAQKLCKDIKTIVEKGGFIMQKWSSNNEEVLTNLKTDDKQDNLEIKLDKVIRILGLTWDRKEDMFKVKVDLPEMKHPVTKRVILSDVARLFDPFGWLSPVIVVAKMMIQRLWLNNLGWDEELPANLIEEWISYRDELTYLQNVEVPRWLHTSPQCKEIQIHGLADASSKSYAAVAYLRVIDETSEVNVTIIAARSKIAPLKQLTIPRVELCAALLLAELIQDIVILLKVPMNQVYAYTDSMVVLSWLQSQPSRWQTFVGNRVAAIQRILSNDRWTHIKSEDNSADIATRGIKANEIVNMRAWWKGPEWLSERNIQHEGYIIPNTDLEMKTTLHLHEHEEEKPIWDRFSSLTRLKRVISYCRRLYTRTSTKPNYLTVEEMNNVVDKCIRYYQNYVYSKEIQDIRKNGTVKAKSSLISLTPFLDKEGLLRVKGRLQNANISDTAKHPIIIPKGVHITKLLIEDAHTKTIHGGISQTMTYIRSRYWVIGLKSAVRKHIRSCKTCIIQKAKTNIQMMGQLPIQRVNQHRAFLNTGVDYAGPIYLKASKGRGHHSTKGYICVFVCMATKAIHLEAASDLTSQAFIAAFRRFVGRRGMCRHLWSDNGTNFVGADKELRNLFTRGKQNLAKEVAELLANDGTTWHFIPPKMPNYGGLWEAGVQAAKRHLSKINTSTKLTFEEMSTLLAQIEACLNSRPLCQLDDTIETLTPLTPGHFLVGEPLISVPDVNYKDCTLSSLSRWQLVQRLTQEFWRKWQSDYLNTLQQRYKWHSKLPAPSEGDVVVIKEDDLPPNKWLLGRVKAIHPGADNLVRVVSVQCKGDHVLKRPLSRLICLPKD